MIVGVIVGVAIVGAGIIGILAAWFSSFAAVGQSRRNSYARHSRQEQERDAILALVPGRGADGPWERWYVIWCLDSGDKTLSEWAAMFGGEDFASQVWLAS